MLLHLYHDPAPVCFAVNEELEWVNRLQTFDAVCAFFFPLGSVVGAADAGAKRVCAGFCASCTGARAFGHA